MKIVFQIKGGIGKSVAATAVCSAIKNQYPDSKIIVITGYPEVFEGNRKIYKVLRDHELNYFWQEHIDGQEDTKFLMQEPYVATDFIHRRGHLIKVWCEMNGITYNGELPELFLSHKEKTSFGQMFQSPKPIFVIQTNGGLPNQTDKYSWPRDLPFATAQKIVNHFAATHNVVQIRRKDQPTLQNVYPAEASFRQLAVLIAMSDKRLFIDSFAQHTAAALGLSSVVFWIANIPTQFGYEMHKNIIANPPTLEPELRNAILARFNTNGPESEFPYNNEDEIIDANVIIAALTGSFSSAPDDKKKQVEVKPFAKEQENGKVKEKIG